MFELTEELRVIRVVELEHSERCKLVRAVAQTPNEYVAANSSKVISPPEISASGASRSSSPEAPLSASLKVSMESNKQPAFHRLSTTSGLRVKLVQRDSGLSTAPSSPIRSPVPKSRSSASSQSTTSVATPTSPPQLDDTFPSLETFHAHTKKWINANFPQYFIYFRSRKGDRPEFYCKYQNSPGATTTPGLGCKFGFNAKRKVSSDGTELYVVTKVSDLRLVGAMPQFSCQSVSYHIPECLRKTGQDAQEAGGSDVADKKRKNSVIQESVYRDDRHDDNNKRFKA